MAAFPVFQEPQTRPFHVECFMILRVFPFAQDLRAALPASRIQRLANELALERTHDPHRTLAEPEVR